MDGNGTFHKPLLELVYIEGIIHCSAFSEQSYPILYILILNLILPQSIRVLDTCGGMSMNRYLLILITGCLLIALSGPVSALPSAHNYDCS
ncbi:MAG: hypothetical protein WCX22_08905, partial [Methanoregula sp.]